MEQRRQQKLSLFAVSNNVYEQSLQKKMDEKSFELGFLILLIAFSYTDFVEF